MPYHVHMLLTLQVLLLFSWKRIKCFSSERVRLGKSKKEKERLIDQELQVCFSGDNDVIFTSGPIPLFCPILFHCYTLSLILPLLCCKTLFEDQIKELTPNRNAMKVKGYSGCIFAQTFSVSSWIYSYQETAFLWKWQHESGSFPCKDWGGSWRLVSSVSY